MDTSFELVIVIPTYNEAKRLSLKKYFNFLETHKSVMLCFVDDGSTDNTRYLLHTLALSAQENVKIIAHAKNKGKAAAVLSGFLYSNANMHYKKIAYLDADLSTSLEECYELSKHIQGQTLFVFGSRIRKLDNYIRRKPYRFYCGRAVATLISKQLNLYVYDTQCGCKIFSHQLAQEVVAEKFISTWLFDVEIFHRIRNLYGKRRLIRCSKEVPLHSWIDKDHSKVRFAYVFRMFLELIVIGRKYRSTAINTSQTDLSEAIA
ncbi:MAG: glycosyltransferase [Bacteroidota bacterium]